MARPLWLALLWAWARAVVGGDDHVTLMAEGQRHADAGRFGRASKAYGRAAAAAGATDSDRSQALVASSDALMELGDTERALDQLRSAITLSNTNIDAHSRLGQTLADLLDEETGNRREEMLAEATTAFRALVRLSPDNPSLLSNCGLFFGQ